MGCASGHKPSSTFCGRAATTAVSFVKKKSLWLWMTSESGKKSRIQDHKTSILKYFNIFQFFDRLVVLHNLVLLTTSVNLYDKFVAKKYCTRSRKKCWRNRTYEIVLVSLVPSPWAPLYRHGYFGGNPA